MIKNYLDLIDLKYMEAKKSRISRFSTEWGIWSREMNIETQKLIKENHPQSLELKYVFIYWVNISQLLELYHKSKLGMLGLKKKIEKESKSLRKEILNSKLIDITEKSMKETLLKGVIKKK